MSTCSRLAATSLRPRNRFGERRDEGIDVGVVENDHRRFAAELEVHALE